MAQAFLTYIEDGGEDRFIGMPASYFKDTPVSEITGEAIRRGARQTYPKGSAATRNRQFIVPTVAAINHASELGWSQPIRVRRFKVNPKTKTPADLAWVNAFATQATELWLPELAALCLFMFGTGARIGEATALTWADVDFLLATATIRQTKTNTTRTAHLPQRVMVALANCGGNRDPDEIVFGYANRHSVTKTWKYVAQRAGIAELTPHCCRHGFATSMLHKGFDPKTVADRGGWKDATTVLRTYAHAIEDPTTTDALFDTELTQDESARRASTRKQKGKH